MLFPWLTSRDIIHNGFMKTITVGDVFEVLHIRSFSSFCMESGARNSFVKIRARESLVSFEELGPLFLFSNKTVYSFMACPSGRSEPDMQVNWRNHEGLCGLHRGGGMGNECR